MEARRQTNVRLPHALRQRLEQSAERAGRSLAAEVVARLEASFAGEAPPPAAAGEEDPSGDGSDN